MSKTDAQVRKPGEGMDTIEEARRHQAADGVHLERIGA